jgi:hypothetical protein
LNRHDGSDSPGRVSSLFNDLTHLAAALPDVLREIGHILKGIGAAPVLCRLLTRHPNSVRKALHGSLKFEGQLTSAFPHAQFFQKELFMWTISTLADIGDSESIVLLRRLTDSTIFGKGAIRAIELVEQRATAAHRQETRTHLASE